MADQEAQYVAKIPELRERFFSKYADSVNGDVYDAKDLDRFKKDDKYVECFLRSMGTEDLDKPAEKADTVFKFRKEIGVNEMTEDSVQKELKDEKSIVWKGEDLEGHKILLFKVANHKKGQFVEEMKKYIFYTLDQYQQANPTKRIVLIFDFTNAGTTNVDLDVTKFLISALTNYFPCLLKVILLFEMPFLLRAVWAVIKSWLSEEQKTYIKQVSKSDITTFIAADQLEEHMAPKK